jgi:hypothetical protein
MSKSIKAYQEPTHDEIAACARAIYEMEGRPEGKAVEHWLQAEAQLIAERKIEAGKSPAKAVAKAAPDASQAPANRKAKNPAWTAPTPAPERPRANPN